MDKTQYTTKEPVHPKKIGTGATMIEDDEPTMGTIHQVTLQPVSLEGTIDTATITTTDTVVTGTTSVEASRSNDTSRQIETHLCQQDKYSKDRAICTFTSTR